MGARTFAPDARVRTETGERADVVRHVPGRPELVVVSVLREHPEDGMSTTELVVPARTLAEVPRG